MAGGQWTAGVLWAVLASVLADSWTAYQEQPCCRPVSHHRVRHHRDHIREFSCGSLFYRTLYLNEERNTLYVGAMDRVFRLNMTDISQSHCERDALLLEASNVARCVSKGKSEPFECRNHIRVLQPLGDGERLYVCGTNAHSPKDWVVYLNLTHLPRHEYVPGVGLGVAKCPYDPADNSTAVWVTAGNPGGLPTLYAGTNAEFTKADPVIFRNDLYDFRTGQKKFNFKRTLKYDSKWLDKTNLTDIPEELGKLMKLENLSLKKNSLEKLFGELTELKCLRSLNVRHNKVKSSGIPAELFRLEELTTLDLSHNRLKEVPEGLEKAKSLLVLNLSHNKIESIPPTLFVQLTDLLFLDLSHNLLETLPPQTRRLANLQTLILNDNPLGVFQLRQLPSLQSLETLHMRNTQRTLANLPASLDTLSNLTDVDLSKNALTKVPDALYSLLSLKRLNLSDNEITEVSAAMDNWQKLESLNLSRNNLTALPASMCKLQNLRRLHVDDNKLDFEGIPSGIGKLGSLEVFSAANNVLEMIPEGLCRCGSLKKLNLSCNKLITLPDAIHLLSDLESLQLHGNPELVMPPKPVERPRGAGLQYYNIDFSLQAQLQLAGAATNEPTTPNSVKSDPIARKLRLRRGRAEPEQRDSALILRGMQEQANTQHNDQRLDQRNSELKPKRWDESLEKPPLDYSEFFDEDTGQTPGLQVWEIENFIPAPVDEVAHGKFFEGDCYIVLKTAVEEQGQLSWDIHFWIGSKATLDKAACAAMHAVNLRNLLGAKRTQRHEQADEAPDFLALFPIPPVYIQGSHTPSGFFTVDDPHYVTRLYRVHGAGNTIHLEPVAVQADSLDPRYVFVLDTGLVIYLWYGKKAKNTLKSKARLFAEKINKEERKNKAELIAEPPGKEPNSFWETLGYEGDMPYVPQEHVGADFSWAAARLYRVELGMGYLELPQPDDSPLAKGVLATRNVYILDAHVDVFVWFGKKSSRLVRAAAVKLAQELFNMVARPPHALVTRLQEGTETQVFKTYFLGWDEVIAVDFTRTAESVARTGADLASWAKQQETKADLSALFTPRQPAMGSAEAKTLADEWNEDLEAMEAFVLEGRHFVRLPDAELGVFYSCDCYVFLCRYVLPAEPEDERALSLHDTDKNALSLITLYGSAGNNIGDHGYFVYLEDTCDQSVQVSEDLFDDTALPNISAEEPEHHHIHVHISSLWYWWKEVLLIAVSSALLMNLMIWPRFFAPKIRAQTPLPIVSQEQQVVVQVCGWHPDQPGPRPNIPEYSGRYENDFTPLRCLGRGGFGVVFEAKNNIDHCSYAVKRITLPRRESKRERVLREVRALAKLDHEHIVRYFNAWVEEPPPLWQKQRDEVWMRELDGVSVAMSDEYTATSPAPAKRPPSDVMLNLKSSDLSFDALEFKKDEPSKRIRSFSCDDSFSIVFDENAPSSDKTPTNDVTYSKTNDVTHSRTNDVSHSKPDDDSFIVFAHSETESKRNSFDKRLERVKECDYKTESSTTGRKKKKGHTRHWSLDMVVRSSDPSPAGPHPQMYLYIQMQLCRRDSLHDWLRDNRKCDARADKVKILFSQIVSAVEYVHLAGLIHRDLKPSNILFAPDGRVKVGDFGLVTAMNDTSNDGEEKTDAVDPHQRHTYRVGTHLYMSPEQLLGRPYSYKVDIYSLGLILFELLQPFATEAERVACLLRLRNSLYPEQFTQSYPQETEVLKLMLSEDPSQRPTATGVRARAPLFQLTNPEHHFILPAMAAA